MHIEHQYCETQIAIKTISEVQNTSSTVQNRTVDVMLIHKVHTKSVSAMKICCCCWGVFYLFFFLFWFGLGFFFFFFFLLGKARGMK